MNVLGVGLGAAVDSDELFFRIEDGGGIKTSNEDGRGDMFSFGDICGLGT